MKKILPIYYVNKILTYIMAYDYIEFARIEGIQFLENY